MDLDCFRNSSAGIKTCRWFYVIKPSKIYDKNWSANSMWLELWCRFVADRSEEELAEMLNLAQELAADVGESKNIKEHMAKLRQQGGHSLAVALKIHHEGNRRDMRILSCVWDKIYETHSRRTDGKHDAACWKPM